MAAAAALRVAAARAAAGAARCGAVAGSGSRALASARAPAVLLRAAPPAAAGRPWAASHGRSIGAPGAQAAALARGFAASSANSNREYEDDPYEIDEEYDFDDVDDGAESGSGHSDHKYRAKGR